MYYVYILKSLRERERMYYIGYSNNVLRRLNEHNSLNNKGYTGRCNWKVIYLEGYINRNIAVKREKQLKQFGNVWYGVMKRIT